MPDHKATALSVSAVAKFLSDLVSQNISKIWIRGEVSNLRVQSNGNAYFSLKDEESKLNALVMKFSNAKNMISELKDGREILVFGKISYYKKEGYITLFVDEIELLGAGLLKQRFDELKNKLDKEGLFNREHKKKIPDFPNRIGVITSPTTAAFQDILNVTKRRFQSINIILFPAAVQGNRAANEIARAIRVANRYASEKIDVLLLARGGGSLEDLWCFNEEVVARAIYNSEIPIISAVGHEIDYTIADYVADMRAPTPSAGAELVLKDRSQIIQYISNLKNRLENYVDSRLENARLTLKSKGRDYLKNTMMTMLADNSMFLNELQLRFDSQKKTYFSDSKHQIERIKGKLEALNPKSILSRGYSITYKIDESGNEQHLTSSSQVEKGDVIKTILHDGEIISTSEK